MIQAFELVTFWMSPVGIIQAGKSNIQETPVQIQMLEGKRSPPGQMNVLGGGGRSLDGGNKKTGLFCVSCFLCSYTCMDGQML